MIGAASLWAFVAVLLHLFGAAACALAVVWLARQPSAKRGDRKPTIVALCMTGLWSGTVAALGPTANLALAAEALRNLSWLLVIYSLFAADGRDRNVAAVRPVIVALALVECFQPALQIGVADWADVPGAVGVIGKTAALFHLLVAIGSLVLLHNLYGGAARETRHAIRWSAAGLAGFWAVELNHYAVFYLSGNAAPELNALRGLVAGLMAIPLAIGAGNGLVGRTLRASHGVAFRTLSLLLIGGYLALMFGAAQLLSLLGGNAGRLAQIAFLVAAATVTLLWLPSERLRGWLRVTVLKHLFQHRYDYREEWMRFTRTIGHSAGGDTSLYERAAQSMAEVVASPAALLFLPDEDGFLQEAAHWKWPGDATAVGRLPATLAARLERDERVLELDEIRAGGEELCASLPAALLETHPAWVLVPLLHFDRLAGAVILARPAVPRRLDWEDFDLLKVIARQLASYIAEHEKQSALMESAKFDDFNRRIAFVMHDIKNLASQLSLLARNAEKHADNPDFRADMLVTLRSSADKLNHLLARLGRYGTSNAAHLGPVDLAQMAKAIAARFDGVHPVSLARLDACVVQADAEALEQAIVHLVQNAVEASEGAMPVMLEIHSDGLHGRVEVIDSGSGMEAEFVRNQLFKPFVSSKDGGFGIGAFEARELVRAMGGRLEVQSRPGLGTRFTVALPLVGAAHAIKSSTSQEAA